MPYMPQEQIDEMEHTWTDLIEQLAENKSTISALEAEIEEVIKELIRIKIKYPDVV